MFAGLIHFSVAGVCAIVDCLSTLLGLFHGVEICVVFYYILYLFNVSRYGGLLV